MSKKQKPLDYSDLLKETKNQNTILSQIFDQVQANKKDNDQLEERISDMEKIIEKQAKENRILEEKLEKMTKSTKSQEEELKNLRAETDAKIQEELATFSRFQDLKSNVIEKMVNELGVKFEGILLKLEEGVGEKAIVNGSGITENFEEKLKTLTEKHQADLKTVSDRVAFLDKISKKRKEELDKMQMLIMKYEEELVHVERIQEVLQKDSDVLKDRVSMHEDHVSEVLMVGLKNVEEQLQSLNQGNKQEGSSNKMQRQLAHITQMLEEDLLDVKKKVSQGEKMLKLSNNTLSRMIQKTETDVRRELKKALDEIERSCTSNPLRVLGHVTDLKDMVESYTMTKEKEFKEIKRDMDEMKKGLKTGTFSAEISTKSNVVHGHLDKLTETIQSQLNNFNSIVHNTTDILGSQQNKLEDHQQFIEKLNAKIESVFKIHKTEVDDKFCEVRYLLTLYEEKYTKTAKSLDSQLEEVHKICKNTIKKIKLLEEFRIPRIFPSRSDFSATKKKSVEAKQTVTSQAKSQAVSTSKTPAKPICIFCGDESHESAMCVKFHNLDERCYVLREKGICRKCLKPENHSHDCPQKDIICSICVPETTKQNDYEPNFCHNSILCSAHP